MKKSLIIALLGAACSVASSFGQGAIFLDNYFTFGPNVTYGQAGIPIDGQSGATATVGTGLQAGWTFGFYYTLGNVTGSVASDPSGYADPSTLGGSLALATGTGSTAAFFTSSGDAGEAVASSPFTVAGTAAGGGDTLTVIAVAYNGSSYTASNYRGHSTAFTMTTGATASPTSIGTFMPGFSVVAVPEPSVFALAGLGAFVFLRLRRCK